MLPSADHNSVAASTSPTEASVAYDASINNVRNLIFDIILFTRKGAGCERTDQATLLVR